MAPLTRIASSIVALSAWAGLILPIVDARQSSADPVFLTLWKMVAYFTILTNLLIALAFTAIALGYAVAPWLLGGILVSIVLVAIIYALLLRDIPIGDTRAATYANTLLHMITPVLVTVYWIAFAPKGQLQWIDAGRWVMYPFAYLGYVLVRGHFTQRYPYPFIHVEGIGWPATLRNAALIALAFVAASLILVAIDHLGTNTT